ncbi:uncharacterized protein [Dermacentor albipictus]|uniref:uncharacterized protein isoform X4 n=1 Tax=Dermacentor albipictus TaxID=60249 RepID=UPI0038FC6EC2
MCFTVDVPLCLNMVVPNPSSLQVDPIQEPAEDHSGDKPNTEVTPQGNKDESPSPSTTNDELFPCVWCPALRTLDATSEPAQMSSDRSINSRSLVQTDLEAVPRSVRQRVKARTDFFEVHETKTYCELGSSRSSKARHPATSLQFSKPTPRSSDRVRDYAREWRLHHYREISATRNAAAAIGIKAAT